jgi:hypothetical protein
MYAKISNFVGPASPRSNFVEASFLAFPRSYPREPKGTFLTFASLGYLSNAFHSAISPSWINSSFHAPSFST